jgi:putative DNA primase/helicase
MMGFIAFASAHGVLIDRLYPSDRIQRFPTETHPRKKNGAAFYDGSRGFIFNWETDARVHWWNDPNSRPWTEAEKREWKERQQRARREQAQRQADAAIKAADMVRSARPDTHGYLQQKGFPDAKGLVLPDGELLVPMRDCQSNALIGAQVISVIDNAWQKKMLYGQRAKGAVLKIGSQRAALSILCEGYATGLSIKQAAETLRLDAAVVVCFSASNIEHVAPIMRGNKAVFADNDASGTGERVARSTGLPWVMSDTVGHDANDIHKARGILAVCRKLLELKQQ